MKKQSPLIGAHVSAAGGLYKAIERGEALGVNAIQIFGASPRQYQAKIPSDAEAKKFRDTLKASAIKEVYLHAAYLVNLASPEAETRKKSIKNLSAHFEIAHKIGARGLIYHVGSGKESPKKKAIQHVISGMKEVLKKAKGDSVLIMENAAGGGAKLGSTAEDMAALMRGMKKNKRIKICFDTAHAFEAGIIEEYIPKNIKVFFDKWETAVGLEAIVAFHVNDSKTAFNSKHDRHENLGEGYIGMRAFQNLAKERRLHHATWLLEVPGFDGEGPDQRNVDLLKRCFE